MDSSFSRFAAQLRERRYSSTVFVTLTLVIGILIGTVISREWKAKGNISADASPIQLPAPQQMSSAFSQVAKTIEPAVVNINTESTVRPPRRRGAPDRGNEDEFQDFFERFFGGPGGQGGGRGMPQEDRRQRSLGSGVILDPKGYIVTNAHVVERADRIRVHLVGDPASVQYDAKVVGSDRETDIAVIKIEAKKPLPFAKLGNSDSMNVGDWVLAIGSPFGLDQTVSAGIVSFKGRVIDNRFQFQSYIQTDAAINPGNSGGPLVNMNSEVIGINTAIFTQTMGSQGVGFAMPSKIVADVYNQLIGPEHRVTRGSIGVQFSAEANPAVARVYGVESGVTITDVTEGGPAASAGLKTGDTIVSVDGKSIKNGDELVGEISARKPGSKARLGYIRGGKKEEATVTVADRSRLFRDGDEEDEISDAGKPAEAKLGMSVRAITPDVADRLQVTPGKGVLVSDVRPGSFADDVGLSRGAIVLEINRQPVNSEEDFRRVQSGLKSGQDVVFLVQTGGRGNRGTVFLAGTLP